MKVKLKYKIHKISDTEYRLRNVDTNKLEAEIYLCYEEARLGLWGVNDNSDWYMIVNGDSDYQSKLKFATKLVEENNNE